MIYYQYSLYYDLWFKYTDNPLIFYWEWPKVINSWQKFILNENVRPFEIWLEMDFCCGNFSVSYNVKTVKFDEWNNVLCLEYLNWKIWVQMFIILITTRKTNTTTLIMGNINIWLYLAFTFPLWSLNLHSATLILA